MKSLKFPSLLIQTSLLAALISCSDSTQFTEKTVPGEFDVIGETETVGQTNPAPEAEGDPSNTANPEGLADGSEPNDGGAGAPGDTGASDPSDEGNGTDPVAEVPDDSGDPIVDNPVQNNPGNPGGGTPDPVTPTPTPDPIVPPVASNPPVEEIFSACEDEPGKALVAKVYQLPENTANLPTSFSGMSAVDDVCISNLNIADRDFNQGFPGVADLIEWFALDITYRVNIPVSGKYTFYINSDDGSKLYIDNSLIINNDGQHAQVEKSAEKTLSAGIHNFRVKYFQGPRMRIALELRWKTPGSTVKEYIPSELMSRPEE